MFIQFALGTATASSVTPIPSGSIVVDARLNVTTGFSAGTTISLGQTGAVSAFLATGDNDATTIALYDAPQVTAVSGSGLAVLATVSGGPSVGAATVIIEYVTPNP